MHKHFRGNATDRYFAADIGFNIRQSDDVFLATETDCISFSTCARSATDAMHIIFRILHVLLGMGRLAFNGKLDIMKIQT